MQTKDTHNEFRKAFAIDLTMDVPQRNSLQTKLKLLLLSICLFSAMSTDAQVPDPNQGLRADWLRGTWGINWKPSSLYNGGHEGLSVEPFLDQISHLRTIDYIQVHLNESYIYSPVHMGPHPLLESFWQGDTDANGNPINLVVPRASFGEDPFLEIIKDIRAAGMKIMVYVNSSNMLNREGTINPSEIPNITTRWKEWCDTDPEAQTFIASQPYHTDVWNADLGTYVDSTAIYPDRKYMFCYAEFVLKDYAIRYGDLIDSWCFDSGIYMGLNGDKEKNGVYEDQMIFNAFKAACHAGNPNAALSFNNGPERDTEELNPFSEVVHADDFMFGHPYNGGNNMGSHTIGTPPLYDRNYAHIEKIKETFGNVHSGIDPQTWTWDDNVVGHFDPPMSTTSWSGGNTPALTDEEFNLWNLEAVQYGGAISWGLALVLKSGTNEQLVARDWALSQLNGMDTHLMELESPGAPNWARQETILSEAMAQSPYAHNLVDGFDFWDPEEVGVTGLSVVSGDFPEWGTLTETTSGTWTISGTPTEAVATDYIFELRAQDADGGTNRTVKLRVMEHDGAVQIRAAANTNYGINTVATMYSELQTAPDGLATFRISIDVTPQDQFGINSGPSGGAATENSWGMGDGTTTNQETLFLGSDNQWVESVNNIQIIDFNANGGSIIEEDINGVFKSITLVNAQHANDLFSLQVGTTTSTPRAATDGVETIDLLTESGISGEIIQFAIGTANEATNNRWSVEGVTVAVDYEGTVSTNNQLQNEMEFFKVFPNPANDQILLNIKPVTAQVFDVMGKCVLVNSAGEKELDISNLKSGLYILLIETPGEKVLFKKFLKQ